jgi:hypothetical protein
MNNAALDGKGQALAVGDSVVLPAKVTTIEADGTFIIETVFDPSSLAVESDQVIRANPGDDTTFEVPDESTDEPKD